MSQLTTQFGRFQLQEIFAQLSSALLLTDVDGVLQDWNERAAELLNGVLQQGERLYGLMGNEMELRRMQRQVKEVVRGTTGMLPRLKATLRCADGTQRLFSVGLYALKKPRQPMALLWQLEPAAVTGQGLSHDQLAALLTQEVLRLIAADQPKATLLASALGCQMDELAYQPRLQAVLGKIETLFTDWLDPAAPAEQVRAAAQAVAAVHDHVGVPQSFLFEIMMGVQDLARKHQAQDCFFHNGNLFVKTVLAGQERLLGERTRLMQDKERELAEQESYWREVFNGQMPSNVAALDGTFYEVNDAYAELVGYSKEELYRTGWLELTPPEYRDEDSRRLPDLMAGKTIQYEKEYIHKDGHRIPILIFYHLLHRRPGWDQDRIIVVTVDITPLKQKEAELNAILAAQQQAIDAIGERLSGLAQGDLVNDAPQGLQGDLARLGEDLGAFINTLRHAVGRIQLAVSQIRSGLVDLTAGNHSLDERTQQQAASTEEISTSIEELSSSVAQSAEHASITARRADEVRSHAEAGSRVIEAAEEKMAAIAKASEAIAEIITVVDEIAFTTNLLALNAAVEAARAGEHGRGFAVVASEVRRLAQSSARNAKDIKQLIARSTSLITEGSHLSAQGTQAFNAILQGIREVNERIAEIAEATSSQGQASAQLTTAITEVSRATQANSALVEENSTACASLAEQAEQLEELAGIFRVG